MSSSVSEQREWQGPRRIGPSFQLLMQIRTLLTALTLFMLPAHKISLASVLLVFGLSVLYWLASHYWSRIVPLLVAHPLLTVIDLFTAFAVLIFEGPSGPFFLSTVAASAVAGLIFRWRGMLLVSMTQVVCYFAATGYYSVIIARNTTDIDTFQTVFGQPAYYFVAGLLGVMLRRLFDEQAAAEEARHDAEVRMVAADERSRLAREMHDSLAKTLRGIAMSAQALPVWTRKSPERASAEAKRIASAAEVASREARELISDLRDDTVQESLVSSVHRLLQRHTRESGVEVHEKLDEYAELSLVARYELISILKESLTNIERHANAAAVTVTITTEHGGVTMTVADDGDGFTFALDGDGWLDRLADNGHYGVIGMHERAKRAGGDLTMRSAPGIGTTLSVVFPESAERLDGMRPVAGERRTGEAE